MYQTFAELKTAIQSETARTDTAFVARLEEFVRMAQGRIYHGEIPLRVREMEKRASNLAFANGSGALPDDFLQSRRLTWNAVPGHSLKYRIPDEFYGRDYYAGDPPIVFTIEGKVIDIKPATSGQATLSYYAEPPVLSGETDTNDVLKAFGQIYLYAALVEAYLWLRNPDKPAESMERLRSAIDGANLTAAKARYAGTQLSPRIPGACR